MSEKVDAWTDDIRYARKLQEENKILGKDLADGAMEISKLKAEIKALKENRNELLEWCKALKNQYSGEGKFSTELNDSIQKAEALKE